MAIVRPDEAGVEPVWTIPTSSRVSREEGGCRALGGGHLLRLAHRRDRPGGRATKNRSGSKASRGRRSTVADSSAWKSAQEQGSPAPFGASPPRSSGL